MSAHIPPEPTAEQCNNKERVDLPSGTRAHAVWWPQMGGYCARAVITVGSCKDAWIWHDGQFPFNGADRQPAHLHLDDEQEWIELFEQLATWYDEEFNDGPGPYVWQLPPGVTREQAREVHEKAIAWGLWEPDPGGFEIRTHAESLKESLKPCMPIPCGPLADNVSQTALYAELAGREPEDPLLVQLYDARLDAADPAGPTPDLPTP